MSAACPVTERQPDKSRRGIYRLRDPFLAFWFRFVAPHFSTLEVGHTAPIARLVAAEMSQFVGPVFEDLCREWVAEQAARQRLPFLPERIGAWWSNEEEIDLVAAGEGALLVGECKWTNRPVGTNVLDDLKRKAHLLAFLRRASGRRLLRDRRCITASLRVRGSPPPWRPWHAMKGSCWSIRATCWQTCLRYDRFLLSDPAVGSFAQRVRPRPRPVSRLLPVYLGADTTGPVIPFRCGRSPYRISRF